MTSRYPGPPISAARFGRHRSESGITLRLCGALLACFGALGAHGYAQRTPVLTADAHSVAALHAEDAGPVAGSEPLQLTLRLLPDAAQEAVLEHLLMEQTDPHSPEYHHWLTPQSFGERFGASASELDQLTSWLVANGFAVTAATPTRVTFAGTASDAAAAFAVPMERMRTAAAEYFAASGTPSLPDSVLSRPVSLSGLGNLPSTIASRLELSPSGTSEPRSRQTASPLEQLEAAVDGNTSAVLALASALCSADLATSEQNDLRAVLRQANAQGISVLVAGSCSSATDVAFPSALPTVTAVTLAPSDETSPAGDGTDGRPGWQTIPGLPDDILRHAPDLTTPSLAAFTTTIRTLVRQTGERVGNLNARLYQLAVSRPEKDEPRLFEQETPGTWTASTGLGTVNLQELLKLFPRTAVASTSTSLIAPPYAINYGDSITFTSTVTPSSYGSAGPTGTITFTASSQGVLGTVSLNSGGTATLTPDVLPVGTYSVVATYSGDANYAASSSNNVTVTVSIVNATVVATIAPQANVPYGATATVTATVKLPGPNASPSGTVTAVIQSVGSLTTATLSPNPGGNSATANLVVSVPAPNGSPYTVQVSCQGNSNYQCQSPVNLTLTTVKGYTTTSLAVTPAAPQAGQPVLITATVANSGNGTGTYVYTGSVSFYDNGKLLTTVPVATNQAATTVSLSGNRTHNLTATYTGDSNWNTSTSGAVSVTPTILPDVLTLGSNVSSGTSLVGVNIIFTATTTAGVTYGVGPTGTVTFFDTYNGSVVQLGNPATVVANGPSASIALFTTTGLLGGTHSIYAVYSGDANFAPATSPVLQLTLADFSLSMTPTSLTLAQGKSQAVTALLGVSGGFSGTVSLGCTPPPSSQATCTFAPSSISSGGTTTLTIITTAASAALRSPAGVHGAMSPSVVGASTLAALLWFLLPGRRQRQAVRRGPLGLLALLCAATLLSGSLGCGLGVLGNASNNGSEGSGSTSGSGDSSGSGTPLGTQNFTITAAASDGTNFVRHTYQYQVTIQ